MLHTITTNTTTTTFTSTVKYLQIIDFKYQILIFLISILNIAVI